MKIARNQKIIIFIGLLCWIILFIVNFDMDEINLPLNWTMTLIVYAPFIVAVNFAMLIGKALPIITKPSFLPPLITTILLFLFSGAYIFLVFYLAKKLLLFLRKHR